jgi:GntR family transcriptional regulator of arabinose operon
MDIVNWTTEQIAANAFKPKDKFLSEAALGRKFDCSRQTVRRALEMLEQLGHITRIQGSGTYISSGRPQLSEGKSSSMTLGLISTFLDNYIFPSIIRGIESVSSADGFGLLMVSTNNQVVGETRALQHMLERQVDGLIVEPTRSALPCVNVDLYQTLIQRGIPLLFIDSFYPELSIPYVALDDVKAGYVATQHLLSMGHSNILGIFPHNNRQGHLRYLGYVKSLADHEMPIQEDRICWYSMQSMIPTLLSNQFSEYLSTCTAALCYNDSVALMLIDFLRQNGRRVPEDFSVVGIDNSELANFSSLTSVVHPAQQLGEAAAKLMLTMINGAEGNTILFEPKLVVRSSVRQLEG